MARTHHLPAEQVHFTWDTRNEPRVVVDSSDTVVVLTVTSATIRSDPTRMCA